jgi:putative membrane-bound dehydrogenase-like protein
MRPLGSAPIPALLVVLLPASAPAEPARAARPDTSVGVARVDVTPRYPVRLSGFGFRRSESEGVSQHIWARALALDDGEPAVLITVDNLGIPASMVEELARRLARKARLARDRLAVTASHTHTAPMLTGVAPTLFGEPIPKEHQEHIDRYTRELTDKLEEVALAALADRKPARLSWGIGTVGFAVNRRTKGGPVDHDLPVLVVRDPGGKVRALYVSYACHCVTLSHNKISGDWAGYAQELIQEEFPGAIALVSIGCGADSNPSTGVSGDRVELALRQGAEIAREVKRLLGGYLAPVTGKLTARSTSIDLPLAPSPARAEWQERLRQKGAVGYHARVQLDRLARKEALRTAVPYRIQTWAFGDSLAMVFLPGEVVVDYSRRLKRELDGLRLWVNAYANDAPCYIPSERVLKEGGYEGGGAMIYYDLPGPFQPGLEKRIQGAVHEQLDARFKPPSDPGRTGGSRPLSPQQSLAALRTKPGLQAELVAAEPLVADPVAIDWGPDGRMWVAEMHDYPSGRRGKYEPGGRIKVLEDTDGDGVYDRATVFLDDIPFPTGVRVWRKGVLVCAAPDILYAEDSDGDGKADVVRKLFSGFGTDNYQARVNSLEYGLDGWVHGSCGLFGGKIRSFAADRLVSLGDRDFRIRPDEGLLEPATGRTQQGRVRDDWGSWFGCDNSTLCRHYPLADHYLRRNPHAAPQDNAVMVPRGPDPNRLYPIAELQLFKLSGPAGRTTAACGLGIYRDTLLGPEYTGNAFVCEPVNLVVHRLCLSPERSTFAGRRAADEQDREFLASTDGWFRPVRVRTGPDGALWVVDMYRFVIEHPRWIPAEDLARIDVRAGDTLGRIYRIQPADQARRRIPRLDRLDSRGLAAALDSPNGWQRDLAGQMLLWRNDRSTARALTALVATGTRPEARMQALCVLDGLEEPTAETILLALGDKHAGVRRQAVRLAETRLAAHPRLGPALLERVQDADGQVRLQLACSLGEWHDPRAARGLARLALGKDADAFLTAAVLSSVQADNVADVLAAVFAEAGHTGPPEPLARQLFRLAAALGGRKTLSAALLRQAAVEKGGPAAWQLAALAGMLDALQQQGQTLEQAADAEARQAVERLLAEARRTADAENGSAETRLRAIGVLGRLPGQRGEDVALLGRLLVPHHTAAIQSAAISALGRTGGDPPAALLIERFGSCTPALQAQVLDVLLSRPRWQGRVLEALEKKEIPAAQIDAARRQRLLRQSDAAGRERAARLFADSGSDRARVIESYRKVLQLPGDVKRGREVFGKRCAVCHQLQGVGHAVGPDLASLANKTPLYLLTEILDPNRNIDSRYVEYVATTKEGRTFSGLLASETATSVTLRGQEGREEVLLRANLDELRGTGKSLMPEGLERDLGRQDMADLLAFLTGKEKEAAQKTKRP